MANLTKVDAHPFPHSISSHTHLLPAKDPEIFEVDRQVYVKGARGIDPNPYTILKVLGNGQYQLLRNGKSDGKVYKQDNLQLEP